MYKAEEIKREDFPPDSWPDEIVYLIEDSGRYKWAYLKCPCGCKETLSINLHMEGLPKWTVKLDENKTISIYPSINRTSNCKSHFNITDGKLIMH